MKCDRCHSRMHIKFEVDYYTNDEAGDGSSYINIKLSDTYENKIIALFQAHSRWVVEGRPENVAYYNKERMGTLEYQADTALYVANIPDYYYDDCDRYDYTKTIEFKMNGHNEPILIKTNSKGRSGPYTIDHTIKKEKTKHR